MLTKNLKEYYTDLVYNCKGSTGSELKISLLFEHKSFKPNNEYLQLLRYMVNIWSYQEKNKQPLSLIIPVIFYHGKQTWNMKPFTAFFSGYNESLYNFLPDFKYILTDISRYDDETIHNELFNREINRALTLIFKYIHDEDLLLSKLFDIFKGLKEYIDDEQQQSKIISFLAYIMRLTEITPEQLQKIFNRISAKGGNVVMTTAMKLREEGIEQGIEQGKLIDRRDTLLRLIKQRFGDGVPAEDMKSIENCNDLDKLKTAIEVLISAKDHVEVLNCIR